MGITIKNVYYNIQNTRTRMPFRFGIVTMTAAPHMFLTAEIEVDGIRGKGTAAEGLLPKWFTKDPESTFKEEIDDMILVIKSAFEIGIGLKERANVFELWHDIYSAQKARCEEKGIPGLLWGFGVSMIERAVIDGFCRIRKVTLKEALKRDLLGIELGKLHDELKGFDLKQLLDLNGVNPMYARHTVGMTDYLRRDEIKKEDMVNDGLPQALEDCVREYGLKRLKIKLSGEIARDISRLTEISGILDENNITDYAFTLDGNENFEDAKDFIALWEGLTGKSEIKGFLDKLIFIEQPIKRTSALSDETKELFNGWKNKPPMIIDESDSEIESLVRALDCGYEGTSHKNCKGVIKGIANACLLNHRAVKHPNKRYLLSGEDLVNIGPVALLQDLTVASLIGVTHIERNGHHYFKGLSMFPGDVQEKIINVHGDLYRRHEQGFATLRIIDGEIRLDSLLDSHFGYGFELDTTRFTPLDEWTFESLGG